jgi:hypothetical protein
MARSIDMIRNLKTVARSLGAIAILAATVGCSADESKGPRQQLQSPTVPFAGLQITIGASRSRLEVGDDTKTSLIQVEVLRTADWTPVANGTDAKFTATLGAIDSPSGGREVTIDLISGKGSITLFPGTTSGIARITVEVLGATASVNVTIDPDPTGGVPPAPAPTQSTLTFICSPSFLSEDDLDDPSLIFCQATVLGTDGEPFKGAGIFMTSDSGLGAFDSSGGAIGSTKTTNSSGQVSDTLAISEADVLAFPGSSFQITAHLGIEGGEKTAAFTVTIVAGPAPAQATTVTLFVLPDATVDDDGGGDSVTLRAIVRDQFDVVFAGATVFFSTQLGDLSAASDDSDGSGVAEVTLTLSDAQLSTFGPDSFTVSADILVDTDTKVITIARTAESLEASFTASTTSPCVDDATASKVQFTDTSTGAILTWSWDLDGVGGTSDSNVADPLYDYFGFTADDPVNVTLIVSDGVVSDSTSMFITPVSCP